MPLKFRIPKGIIRRRGGGGGAPATADFENARGEGLGGPAARLDPWKPWKIGLGVLAVANLAAFFLLVKPLGGGSAADLDAQLANLQLQIKRQQLSARSGRDLSGKLETARAEHDRFMSSYFMDRRTMSSTILTEIKNAAAAAGLTAKEHSFGFEPVEGTENVGMMTITANYEGDYANLVKFVNLIDRSKRFLIIDNIQAAPQQQGGKLVSRFKINAFVRESGQGGASPAAPLEALSTATAGPGAKP